MAKDLALEARGRDSTVSSCLGGGGDTFFCEECSLQRKAGGGAPEPTAKGPGSGLRLTQV